MKALYTTALGSLFLATLSAPAHAFRCGDPDIVLAVQNKYKERHKTSGVYDFDKINVDLSNIVDLESSVNSVSCKGNLTFRMAFKEGTFISETRTPRLIKFEALYQITKDSDGNVSVTAFEK